MGVAEQVEQKFEKFVVFCKSHLDREGEQIAILINKRYNDCSTHFKNTAAMLDLIKSTKSNMKSEPTRNMVHLKDFLQELKAYKKKRKAPADDTIIDRVAKLRKTDDNSSEASTDGIMSDADSNIPSDRMKQNNAVTKDSKFDLSKKNEKYTEKKNNTDELHTNDVKISKICDASKNVSELMGTKIKIESVTSIKTVSNSNDTDGDDVVMVEDDHKMNFSDSCIIIDAPSQKSEEHKASLLSFLNLRKTPGNTDSTTDSDVIICDSDIQSPCVSTEKAKVKAETSSKGESLKNGDKKSETSDGKKKSASEKHIKRLESLLERLKNKIEEMRDQELTLDDLDDDTSSYIYEDKLERKFVTVWNKLCELKGRNRTTGRPAERVFTYGGSRYEELNKKIERMINKYKEFPDFHDVKNVVKKVNKKCNLGLNNSQVDMIARESFLDVGNILQERRHNDFMCTFRCRVQDNFSFERDPALFDVELQRKLDSNQKFGRSNLEDVINKYADKQMYNDRDEVNGDRNKEKEGEGDSHDDEEDNDDDDDEEEEEDEVEEEIIDVDQFVNETEILASYTPSRPAISKNPKLVAFHAQVKQETTADSNEEKPSTSTANVPQEKSEENALPTNLVVSSFVAELSSDLDSEQRNYITGNSNDGAKENSNTKDGGIFLIDSENKMSVSSPMDDTNIVLIDSENESVDSMDETSVKADVTDRKHVTSDSSGAKKDNSSSSPVKYVENVNGINLVDSESEDDNSDKTSKSSMDSNCASKQIVDKKNTDVDSDMELPSPSKEGDVISYAGQKIDSLCPDNSDDNISTDSEWVDSNKPLVVDDPDNDTSEDHAGLERNKSIDSENISDEKEETTMSNINYDSDIEQPTMSKNSQTKSGSCYHQSDSSSRNNNKDDPENLLITGDANINIDSNGIEEDEAAVHDKSKIDESEIKEADVLNLDEDSCHEIDSQTKDSLSMYCELSDDSQSNDCEVIETDSLADDTSEKNVLSVKPVDGLKVVKVPKFVNSPNNMTDIKNRVSSLVNKAMKNIDESVKSFNNDGDAKNVKIECVSVNDSNAKSSTYSKDNDFTCTRVSTSSEDYSHKLPYKKTMVAKHLPTNLIKYKSQVVDSFVIEIDEADRLDSTTFDQDDDEDVCQSTTGKHDLDNNEVSSSICEPDVIILSDSD